MRNSQSNIKRTIFRRLERLQKYTNYSLELSESWDELKATLKLAFPIPEPFDMDFSNKMTYHRRSQKVIKLINQL